MNNTQTITRKIQLYPVGDKEEINRVFKYIRDSQYSQYCALNLLMGQLAAMFYEYGRDLNNESFKELRNKKMTNSNPLLDEIDFGKGIDTKSLVTQKVKQDFSASIKNGLARGDRSITNYKRDTPLMTRGRDLKFIHKYESYQDFLDELYSKDLEVFINWVNKITFKVILGNPHKSHELRSVIKNIFEGTYKVQGSSIQFDKSGKKIILNLSMAIPKRKKELDENTVVGVDLGVAVPAVCALNNNKYVREYIGSKDDFLRTRTKIQAQKRRLQTSLKNSNGGHGRRKKLKPLDKFMEYEKNFVQTYNHMVSKRVVDFALKNNAKYIHMENLEGYDTNKYILRNWSFYQLQQYITYKAGLYGIEVRKINPAYTSQTCSCCGYVDSDNRPRGEKVQAYFHCLECGEEMNADFNAARNIAMSMDFVK